MEMRQSPSRKKPITPVYGPMAQRAALVKMQHDPHHRLHQLLMLVAAYIDAGEQSPDVGELADRMRARPAEIRSMLRVLCEQDLIRIGRGVRGSASDTCRYELTAKVWQAATTTADDSDRAADRDGRGRW